MNREKVYGMEAAHDSSAAKAGDFSGGKVLLRRNPVESRLLPRRAWTRWFLSFLKNWTRFLQRLRLRINP